MVPFAAWLAHRHVETLLRLLERADHFAPEQYNLAFVQGLDDLLGRIHDDDAREQIETLRHFDFAHYIIRSLQRAGFTGAELEEHFHDLITRLLVQPGKLFKGWDPTRHGFLERRFFRSVKNGIINIAEQSRHRRKWMTSTDPVGLAQSVPSRPDNSGVMETFRQHVAHRLGTLALRCLDWRIDGKNVKDLIGRPDLGRPTAYTIKREIQAIKELARQFAAKSDDAAMIAGVQRAMDAEAKTVRKRNQSMVARQAGR
jgi:hypothetical protein